MKEKQSRLAEIFAAQALLKGQFDFIENQTMGTPFEVSIDICSYRGAARIREMAGRVSEEVGEILMSNTPEDRVEEIGDALHFLIELFLTLELSHEYVCKRCEDPGDHDSLDCAFSRAGYESMQGGNWIWEEFFAALWVWMNRLKTKPWKLNPKSTDVEEFKVRSRAIFIHFIQCCITDNISAQELYDAYFKKHSTNLSRIAHQH